MITFRPLDATVTVSVPTATYSSSRMSNTGMSFCPMVVGDTRLTVVVLVQPAVLLKETLTDPHVGQVVATRATQPARTPVRVSFAPEVYERSHVDR